MTWDEEQERKLDKFLHENKPEAPDPPPGEEFRIQQAIAEGEKRGAFVKKRIFWTWLVPDAAAAGVMAVLLWNRNPEVAVQQLEKKDAPEIVAEAYQTVEELGEVGDDSLIGNEYVLLAEYVASTN